MSKKVSSLLGSGHPHCFYCHLELGSDREVPPIFAKYVEVEFSMPAASASKTAVRSISVEERTELKKWVNYSAHYYYKVRNNGGNHEHTMFCGYY